MPPLVPCDDDDDDSLPPLEPIDDNNGVHHPATQMGDHIDVMPGPFALCSRITGKSGPCILFHGTDSHGVPAGSGTLILNRSNIHALQGVDLRAYMAKSSRDTHATD